MRHLVHLFEKLLLFCLIPILIFSSCFNVAFAEEINWIEVAKTSNEIQYIDKDSIKYNNNGLLSVMTKSSEVNPDNQNIINTEFSIIAIDCEKISVIFSCKM